MTHLARLNRLAEQLVVDIGVVSCADGLSDLLSDFSHAVHIDT
jgi:hypothetical protein